VKRTTEAVAHSHFFSRPFHGLCFEIPRVPAMNRWAIVNRPLSADWDTLRKAAKQQVSLSNGNSLLTTASSPYESILRDRETVDLLRRPRSLYRLAY
jgi:hypothetical protein